MGWSFYDARHYKPNGQVDRKKEVDITFSDHYTVLKSVMVGTEHYAAIRNEHTGAVVAAVTVTSSDIKGSGFNFGYKGALETCGPNEIRCPLSILKMLTPTEDEFAARWRKKCYEYHAKAKSPNSFKNLPNGAIAIWTVPCGRFTYFNEGERVTLQKFQEKGHKSRWLCKDKGIWIDPKYVDADDVEIQAA